MAIKYDELTPDGKQLLENIDNYEEVLNPTPEAPVDNRPKKLKTSADRFEVLRLKREMQLMIDNSRLVVRDCGEVISRYKSAEEYITSDAKVAKTIHENLIIRLERVMNGGEAFPAPTTS